MQGDAASVTKQTSGSCLVPRALADVAEEVRDLFRELEISFVHILRSANLVANSPAKEGVGRHSLLIIQEGFFNS